MFALYAWIIRVAGRLASQAARTLITTSIKTLVLQVWLKQEKKAFILGCSELCPYSDLKKSLKVRDFGELLSNSSRYRFDFMTEPIRNL